MNKLFVVGIGPGVKKYMTLEAIEAINSSDIVLGYKVYGEIIKKEFPNKDVWINGMGGEIERCRKAFEESINGKTVSMVCSGDSSVYGMASPILSMSENYPDVDVCVISGNTAAISGGALLGSPLTNDFAVISLSDLLTPKAVINKRIECIAMADICIAFYNVKSKGRPNNFKEACKILLKYKSPKTICGWVRNIGRENCQCEITTLEKISDCPLDMFCTVFIGNDSTYNLNGKMITPRGY